MYSMVLLAALTTGAGAPGWQPSGYGGVGCYGAYSCSSCYGCYACSCWGGHGGWVGWGWYGWGHGGYGCYVGGRSDYSCAGGWYGAGWCGGYGAPGALADPGTGATPEGGGFLPPANERSNKGAEGAVRATLTVELPADARLYVDGTAMKTMSATRRFVTPPLHPGQAYSYELRAEAVRDGQAVSVSRRVMLRPGQSASASFPELQGTATSTARAEGR